MSSLFTPQTPEPLEGRVILQIIPELDAGGAERTTVDVAAGLAAIGARALVASAGGRLVGELQTKGGRWLAFPAATKNPFRMALNARALARLCLREGVDVIHARSRAPAWSALGAARLTGLPLVTTYHGSYSGRSGPKLLYNSVMARGDVVIANSQYTADLIGRLYPFALPQVRTIYRGSDLAQYAPAAVAPARIERLRRAWKVAPDQRIVLLAARLTGWKGQLVLVDAAKLLMERGVRDVVYVLAGDSQGRDGYVRQIDARIAATGLAGIVQRVGHCEDMPAALLAANVVAAPSIEPEAFGRTAVEAQAMGAAVVVSDLGAAPETVAAPPQCPPEDRTGWRVPPGDATALADAIQQALELRASARAAMAYRARRRVEDHFSLERMVDDTLDVYRALIERRAGTRAA